jgi:hypothetical protein
MCNQGRYTAFISNPSYVKNPKYNALEQIRQVLHQKARAECSTLLSKGNIVASDYAEKEGFVGDFVVLV